MGSRLHHYQGHAYAYSGDIIVTRTTRVTWTQASRTFKTYLCLLSAASWRHPREQWCIGFQECRSIYSNTAQGSREFF